MSEIKIKYDSCLRLSDDLNGYASQMKRYQASLLNVQFDSKFQMDAQRIIQKQLRETKAVLEKQTTSMSSMHSSLGQICQCYKKTDNHIANNLNGSIFDLSNFEGNANNDDFWSILKSKYGWGELLAGAGYIGSIYNFFDDIKKGKMVNPNRVYRFINGAFETFRRYKKIGNAVGTNKAMGWWLKSITGVKPLGRASTASDLLTRFTNNLTNKTSPFHAQFVDVIDNFKGANGVGNAVASWGSVALSGVLNWFDNKGEQADSNGQMSDERVVAETITETVVDTVLTNGAGIVVGAAVTTVIGTTAAPGLVVVAAGGLIVAGVNAGVEALTGQTVTEWVSDSIIDFGESVGDCVGDAVNAVGSWFEGLSLW